MNYSIITATLLFKVDTRDYFGFALSGAIDRYVKEKVIKEIEKLTTMNVVDITIVAKGIYMPEEKKDI